MNTKKKMILVVEDDEISRYLEERILRRAGYDTCYTDATDKAWEYVNNGAVDLIVLDADEIRKEPYGLLLREQGLRFLKELRQSPQGARSKIPVVVTTSKLPLNAPGFKDESIAAGADAFFEQEFDLDDLVTAVKKLLPNNTLAIA